jgi:hypothetical protein
MTGTIEWIAYTEDMPIGEWFLLSTQGTVLKGCRLHDGWRIIYSDGQKDIGDESGLVTHYAYINEPIQ